MNTRIKVQTLTEEDTQRIAEDIYIYGYPLLLMEITKRMLTATPYPTLHSAPVNQFAHGRFPPRPDEKSGIHANADCLTSSAWLDLAKEPIVLTIPACDRYHLLSCFSGWHQIFDTCSPRNSGTHGGHFALVPPRWRGKMPAAVKPLVAPTEMVWIRGLLEVRGAEDADVVHNLQDQFRLSPLSEWDHQPVPHSVPFRLDVNQKTTPQEQVATFDARSFYTRLSRLMQRNPAQPCDAEIIAEFVRIGFFPGEDFAFEMLPGQTARAMQRAVEPAQVKIADAEKKSALARTLPHWSLQTHPDPYHKSYLDRAAFARSGVFSAMPEDILCFHTSVDHTGEPLKGTHRYVINFARDMSPPVNAFWSITLYDARQQLVLSNTRRNAIGNWDRLRLNSDNSLSVHIQHEWPGEAEDYNWLPSPRDVFSLALRMYWPKREALTGIWRPPALIRVA
jgi:hypothetical protein